MGPKVILRVMTFCQIAFLKHVHQHFPPFAGMCIPSFFLPWRGVYNHHRKKEITAN